MPNTGNRKPGITEVAGIGPSTAAQLANEGIRTIEELAAAAIDKLATVRGFGATRAASVHQSAAELLRALQPKAGRSKKKKKKKKKGAEKSQKRKKGKRRKPQKTARKKPPQKAKKKTDKKGSSKKSRKKGAKGKKRKAR